VPAWVCDAPQCRYREIVRQTKVSATAESRQAIAASKDVQAAARRTIMKSAARNTRVQKRIAKSAKTTGSK
jgi:hypothetical protein